MTDRMLSTDPGTIWDYLDHPPQRYRDSGNGCYPHPRGEWVKFDDMDLYMLEGGNMLRKLGDYVRYVDSRIGRGEMPPKFAEFLAMSRSMERTNGD